MVSKHLLIASLIATSSMLAPSCAAQVTEYTFKSVVTETTPAPEAVIYHEAQIAEPLTVVETRPVVIEEPAAAVIFETRPQTVVVEEVVTQPTIVVEKKKKHNKLLRLGTMPLRIVF